MPSPSPERHAQALSKPSAWTQQATYYRKYLEKIGRIYTIVELGVDYGYSLFTMAWDYPDALVIGVDSLQYQKDQGNTSRSDHLQEFMDNYPNIRFIEHDSNRLGLKWKNHEFYVDVDVLHIDADHMFNSVKEDFEAWEPHVRPGGAVMFHDVDSFPDDVGKFFNALSGDKVVDGNLGIWYKPE